MKPKVSHFHIFGCKVYIHASIEKTTKLEPSSKKSFLLGYNETSNPCKVYIPEQRKIVVSRDVKFEEHSGSRLSLFQ